MEFQTGQILCNRFFLHGVEDIFVKCALIKSINYLCLTTSRNRIMLDYCSNDNGSSGFHQNASSNSMSMASLLNMNVNMDSNGRQPAFVLSSPPLAALHNMTEMKAPVTSSAAAANFLSSAQYQQSLKNFSANSTPHGIQDILSRPQIHALGLSRLNAAGMYLNSQCRLPKLAELPGRPPIYWPGLLNGPSWRPNSKLCHESKTAVQHSILSNYKKKIQQNCILKLNYRFKLFRK